MKNITFLLLIICSTWNAFGSQVQLVAHYNKLNAIESYDVITWNGPDGQQVTTNYTIQEAQDKFSYILGDSTLLQSGVADLIDIIYDGDGNLLKVVAIATSKSKVAFEKVEKSDFSDIQLSSIAASKDDVETKTGKTIDGKELPQK